MRATSFHLKPVFFCSIKYSMKSQQEENGQVLTVVYRLGKSTQEWEELGTGLFKFQDNFDDQGILMSHSIVVTKLGQLQQLVQDQIIQPTIVKSHLKAQKMYMRQQGTVIYWNEIQLNQQIAVTFSDKKTCDQQWKRLCSFIGKNPYEIGTLPPIDSVQMPREQNLDRLVISVAQKQMAISYYIVNKTKFYIELLQLGRQLLKNEKQKEQQIKLMYNILNGIIQYNDSKIIQILFESSSFQVILKIYNSKHRLIIECLYPNGDYLKILEQRFKLVKIVNFDEQIYQKIKMSHHITFFKDVVFKQHIGTSLESSLLLSIQQINNQIFNYIALQETMEKVYKKMQSQQIALVIDFLHEQLIFIKQFNDDMKKRLIQKYYSSGLVKALGELIGSTDFSLKLEKKSQLKIFQIISKISYLHEKIFLEEFLKQNKTLIHWLIFYFYHGTDQIVQSIISMFKNLLIISTDKKALIDILNSSFFSQVLDLIMGFYSKKQAWKKSIQNIIQLIIFVIEFADNNRISKLLDILIRYNIFHLLIQSNLTKIEKLKRLKLVNIIVSNDSKQIQFIQQTLVDSKLFRTCILWFKESSQKNNLLKSSLMSIFEKVNTSEKLSFMQQIDSVYHVLPQNRIIQEIIKKISDVRKRQQLNSQLGRHQHILQNQNEERYLNHDLDYQPIRKMSSCDSKQDIEESLMMLTAQLGKKDSDFQEPVKIPIIQQKGIQFTFDFGTINQS